MDLARQARLVRPLGEDYFIVRSPALLSLAADWVRAGIPVADALGVIEVLTAELSALARTLAGLLTDRIWTPAADSQASPGELPGLLRRGRPLLLQGVASTLADRLGVALAERAEDDGDERLKAALDAIRGGAVTDADGTIHRPVTDRGGVPGS